VCTHSAVPQTRVSLVKTHLPASDMGQPHVAHAEGQQCLQLLLGVVSFNSRAKNNDHAEKKRRTA
jgi:hypothetical protein